MQEYQDNNITFTPVGATVPRTVQSMSQKAIQELFTAGLWPDECHSGRRIAAHQLPDPDDDPVTATSIRRPRSSGQGETQLWKITHNGVDTHFIHFHLFNVQVINRVGWDGAIRPPDPNELGWKDTVRMNPLGRYRGCTAADQPQSAVPDSRQHSASWTPHAGQWARHAQFTGIDPNSGNATTDVTSTPSQLWLGVRVALPHPRP